MRMARGAHQRNIRCDVLWILFCKTQTVSPCHLTLKHFNMQNMKKEDLKKKAYVALMVGVCYVDVEHQMLVGSDFSGGHKPGGAGGDLGRRRRLRTYRRRR